MRELLQANKPLLSFLAIGCGACMTLASLSSMTLAVDPPREIKASKLHEELSQILDTQSKAWNRGDIPEFMSAYWKSERLTFSSGGSTTRGWQATLDRYLSRYPDKATMGHLTFSELETESLSDDVALMLGRWHLKRDESIGGNFSLVWKKLDGRWLIIHDHSSSNAKP